MLVCECGSEALEITRQSYNGEDAFEKYKCEVCGRTGTLSHDGTRQETTLSGCLERKEVRV